MASIEQVGAREILDSRGNPTVEVEVLLFGDVDDAGAGGEQGRDVRVFGRFCFFLKSGEGFRAGLERGVNGVVGDESKERPGFVFSYKAAGGICDGLDFLRVFRAGLALGLSPLPATGRFVDRACFAGGNEGRRADIETLI